MSTHLPLHLATLHENLLHGKLPRNLSWKETIELIDHLGKVEHIHDEEFDFLIGGESIVFKHSAEHDLSVDEVSRLRAFLKRAESASPIEHLTQPSRMVVVIDHHSAHIYAETGATQPRPDESIKPYDPFHFHHHILHRKEAHYVGEHIPEENSFYEEIAKALTPAVEIVLIGHGTGKSNAAEHLAEYLKAHHIDTAKRIMSIENADLSAITQPQIEELAREHMIAVV
jgi:hypothetical protein